MVDPTNTDLSYERPRLRATAQLRDAVGLTNAALCLSASRLARADAALSVATDALARASVYAVPGQSISISRSLFAAAPLELRVRLLSRALAYSGGCHPAARLSEIERLTERLSSECAAVTLGGCRIAPTADTITVSREPGRNGLPVCALRPGEGATWDNRFTVALSASAPARCTVRALNASEWARLRHGDDVAKACAATALTVPSFWVGCMCIAVPSFAFVIRNRHGLCSDNSLIDGFYGALCTAVPRDGHDLTSSCEQTS